MKFLKLKTKQVEKFAAMAAAIVAAHGMANGQVRLFVPDTTIKLDTDTLVTLNIDINGDSINDFKVAVVKSVSTYSVTTITTTPGGVSTGTIHKLVYTRLNYGIRGLNTVNPNAWIPAANTAYVKAMSSGSKIGDVVFKKNTNSHNLYKFSIRHFTSSTKTVKRGYFTADTEHFIGVKFYDTTGVSYFGWLQIRINGDSSLTLLKYAYEQTGDSIYAGTKPLSLGVADSASTSATIAVQPVFNGKIYYVVLDSTQSLPNAEQVINGTDGDGNAAVVASYVDVTTAPDTTLIDITGLSPSSKYRFCMVMQDETGTNDIDVYSVDFSTTAGTATEVEAENPVVKIYPNPAREYIRLEGVPTGSRVEIYDISGKKVYEVRGFRGGAVNISQLRPGVYNVRVIGKGYLLTKELVKY